MLKKRLKKNRISQSCETQEGNKDVLDIRVPDVSTR